MTDKSPLSKTEATNESATSASSVENAGYEGAGFSGAISTANMLMSAGEVLQLQRTLGNKAVLNMLQQRALQRQSHEKGCRCAVCSGADATIDAKRIQRADEHEEDIQAKRIQRTDEHGEGCGCPACSGGDDVDIQAKRIQRADEHEEDIQAKRIQRADEHEEDIQASRIQRDDVEEVQGLTSTQFAGDERLEKAFNNAPPLKMGANGDAVVKIQQALLDDGFSLPVSTEKAGVPDGIFGDETQTVVKAFQQKYSLSADGIVGRNTLGKMDALYGGNKPGPKTLLDTIKDLIKGASDVIEAIKQFLLTSWNSTISDPEAMKEIAKVVGVSDFLVAGALAGTPLKDRLTLAITYWTPVTLSDLKTTIESSPKEQKDEVWNDGELMGKLKVKLGDDDYLNMQPVLGVFKPGVTAEDNKSHTRADKADEYIRQYLAPYVTEAVKAGRKVEGMVAVVDGQEWLDAYKREFGDDGQENSTNAFVERVSRNIWIHKNRGNAGTIIHEGIHKYCVPDFKNEVGFQFNEGVTEFFTRKVTAALNYRRGNYESNYQFAKKFAELMGEDMVAKAYFDGAVDALKDAYTDKGKNWTTLKTKVNNKQWGAAEALLS